MNKICFTSRKFLQRVIFVLCNEQRAILKRVTSGFRNGFEKVASDLQQITSKR